MHVEPLANDWHQNLKILLKSARENLLIVSPFVSVGGVSFVGEHVSTHFKATGCFQLLCDLSPENICRKSTDPSALALLGESVPSTTVAHLPRLHAKVYICDDAMAIITSANLTSGGLYRNREYGLQIDGKTLVSKVRSDLEEFFSLGAVMSNEQLAHYSQFAAEAAEKYSRMLKSSLKRIRTDFKKSYERAEEELLRLRLSGAARTNVFGRTILFLLKRHGPLSTREMHPLIQEIHPDLCDDRIDRIIDGQRFGKKWKHNVRTSQQHLKDRGVAELREGKWRLVGNSSEFDD